MPLPTGDIVGLMIDNLDKRDSVFPLSARKSSRWAKGLDIPRGGPTVIYTGSMYQLLPYIIAMVRLLARVEDTFLARWVFMGRFANRFVNLSAMGARPSRVDIDRYNQILRNIARLLQQAGVEFGYLYEDDLYAGALAYDMGVDGALRAHANRVFATLRKHGVRRVSTLDPHTTNMLRSVYPTMIEGFDIEVKSYLEVLAEADVEPLQRIDEDVVIHDSCLYARSEGMIDEPRRLLERAGYTVKEPRESRNLTYCCGGPIEALFPSASHAVAVQRVEQLRAVGGRQVTTMCPMCLASLGKAADGTVPMEDISVFLDRAYHSDSADRAAEGKAEARLPFPSYAVASRAGAADSVQTVRRGNG
jgi:Fe-S oxidoreductase